MKPEPSVFEYDVWWEWNLGKGRGMKGPKKCAETEAARCCGMQCEAAAGECGAIPVGLPSLPQLGSRSPRSARRPGDRPRAWGQWGGRDQKMSLREGTTAIKSGHHPLEVRHSHSPIYGFLAALSVPSASNVNDGTPSRKHVVICAHSTRHLEESTLTSGPSRREWGHFALPAQPLHRASPRANQQEVTDLGVVLVSYHRR